MRSRVPNNPESVRICFVGPASLHTCNRVGYIADLGHKVCFLTNEDVVIPGVSVICPSFTFGSKIIRTLCRYFYYRRVIREFRPDIVHVLFAYHFTSWLTLALDFHPLVVTTMGGDILFEEQGDPTKLGQLLTVELLRSADLITAKSCFLIEKLNEQNIPKTKIIKIAWGVDRSKFRSLDASKLWEDLGLRREDRIILSPRILERLYNIHLIVEAIWIVRNEIPNVKLVITELGADRDYKAEIEKIIHQLNLHSNVIFIGSISHNEMPFYYNLAEVVVSIPSSDGFPQSVFEAMACGVPNLLGGLPRYEEIVTHGLSAYLVDFTSVDVAAGITELLKNEKLRQKIIRNGQEIVSRRADFHKELGRLGERYQKLLKSRHSSSDLVSRIKMLIRISR